VALLVWAMAVRPPMPRAKAAAHKSRKSFIRASRRGL
jgi:hypothetical protein